MRGALSEIYVPAPRPSRAHRAQQQRIGAQPQLAAEQPPILGRYRCHFAGMESVLAPSSRVDLIIWVESTA